MSRSTSLEGASALAGLSVPSRPDAVNSACLSTCLSPAQITAISKAREARWRPQLGDQPLHSEIFASSGDASGAGLALALARDALRTQARTACEAQDPLVEKQDRRHVLWVQDARAIQLSGRPYVHGLPEDLRERLIHVEAATPEGALFALEEGLKCRDLACVIGEVAGNPRALNFTASRRLSLAAEKHDVALWLVRLEADADLSSARMRWRVEAAPSAPPLWNADAPGEASWNAELFRARSHAPGRWILRDDETTLHAQKPACEAATQPANTQPANDCQEPALRPRAFPGPALARQHRLWQQGAQQKGRRAAAPDPRLMVRATVGRSLAAVARM